MDTCDVLIVGSGPAGSSCAWGLRQAGLDVLIIDKCIFPRSKVCGGWITPAILEQLRIDPAEYARGRVLQTITGFRTGLIGRPDVETDYAKPISYGIRRIEFDEFLAARCRARRLQGLFLKTLERAKGHWVANSQIKTSLIVGAGGNFCPVAKIIGGDFQQEGTVVAQEAEFEMTPSQARDCPIQPEVPELYFCGDMKGYGWCFRKEQFLNVGLGRMDRHALPAHVKHFVNFLSRKLGFAVSTPLLGHAYCLQGNPERTVIANGLLLVGDAAGIAYSLSGEGIRPAVESGLLAADAIVAANGNYDCETLKNYRNALLARFGGSGNGWWAAIGQHLPTPLIRWSAKLLLQNRWFTRKVVLDRWFLRAKEAALPLRTANTA